MNLTKMIRWLYLRYLQCEKEILDRVIARLEKSRDTSGSLPHSIWKRWGRKS
jgi:hypothetical protein